MASRRRVTQANSSVLRCPSCRTHAPVRCAVRRNSALVCFWHTLEMIIVSGIMAVEPSSNDRMVELARTVAAESLKEPGCRTYGLWAHPDMPGRFRIFEEWESQEALTEHFATPHFAAFGAALGEVNLVEMDVHRYIDPEVADLF
jgi:quinol monooxygenase YgiN